MCFWKRKQIRYCLVHGESVPTRPELVECWEKYGPKRQLMLWSTVLVAAEGSEKELEQLWRKHGKRRREEKERERVKRANEASYDCSGGGE